MRFSGIATLLCAVLALASGCGLTSSPASDLKFAPPHDWRASPAILGFMQFWRSPTDDREVLMLFKSPRPLQPRDFFTDARLRGTVKDVRVERRQDIVICGDQRATYVAARGSSSNGEEDRIEVVATNTAGNTYFAMYARPAATAANAMAEAALRELCPKP
jgi:hypothetical protein